MACNVSLFYTVVPYLIPSMLQSQQNEPEDWVLNEVTAKIRNIEFVYNRLLASTVALITTNDN
jgi:hypothetical protein